MILCIGYRDWALDIYSGLEVACPEHQFTITTEFDVDLIASIEPELILFYGWSQIIPKEIILNYECLMLHPSPLPRYRGGSPLQNQIINGESCSKITIFKMDEGIDTGPILKSCYLSLNGRIENITKRISTFGLALTVDILNGNFEEQVQSKENVSYFPRLKNNEITLNDIKTKDSAYLSNKIRMLGGDYPSAYIKCADGKRLLLKDAEVE